MTDTLPTLEECEKATSNKDYWIGSGGDRMGFHIPGSKWVYKVEKNPNRRVNYREFSQYKKIGRLDLPKNVAIPEMHMLPNGVIAGEFIAGEKPDSYCYDHDSHYADYDACWYNWVDAFSGQTGLWDSSALCNMRLIRDELGNVVKIYMIDLGE